jgi:regulator of sigma D
MNNQKNWIQLFIEKNAWQIIVLVGGMIIVYSTIANQVRANTSELDRITVLMDGIVENQTQILLLQKDSEVTHEDIMEIKDDIKEIKQFLNVR